MGLRIIRRGAAFVLSCGSGLRVVFSLSALMQQIRFRFEIKSDGGVVGTPGQTDSVITTPNPENHEWILCEVCLSHDIGQCT